MQKKQVYIIAASAIVMTTLAMSVYVATTSFAMTMMPGNQTKGKMGAANMTAGSNMTSSSMNGNMTSAAKSMGNSTK